MYKDLYGKPFKPDWMVRRPLQSLLLSYTAENSQKTFEANIERETEKVVHHNMSTLFVQLTQVLMFLWNRKANIASERLVGFC